VNLDRLTITLSWPNMDLMPNRKNGRHWGGTQAAKVRARQEGHMSTIHALGRNKLLTDKSVAVKLTFVAPDNRHRDLDNLLACEKSRLDGIAQALGIDDKHFKPITVDAAVDSKKQGFVIVEIGV
jgi:crossover junction endodeoxyribonuclease RusA